MDGFIAKMVEDLKAQIADYETIDLIIEKLEEMKTDTYSDLYIWNCDIYGNHTSTLINPRAPQIIEEIIGAIKDFYMLVEPPKELHNTDNNTGKHEVLIIEPKEA